MSLPVTESEGSLRAAVIFVGNKLMRDDGVGPHGYDLFCETFAVPESLTVLDVGCMSLDRIGLVDICDLIITVDAVDGTGHPAGTVFRFSPEDMARHSGANASLHDLKLVDLFDAATLLGYSCEGVCLGMQVFDRDPEEYDTELTPACREALPLLVETVAAELCRHGITLERK